MGRLSEQLAPETAFDGKTYAPALDQKRLTGQLERVFTAMSDGQWHSLDWLAVQANGTEASVSARLRDLRKFRCGSHFIDRRRIGTSGLFQYRLVPRETP
jgi:hypothetical protein